MTEDDLHHKLNNQDGRRLPTQYYPQQNTSRWDQPKREELRRAGKDPVPEGGNKGMLCYNCHQYGHHKSQCTNPSYCYNCKLSSHIAPKCPSAKVNKGLKLCGFGMPGQLFYSMTIPVEQAEVDKSIRAIVTVLEGRGTRFRIDTELKYLADS